MKSDCIALGFALAFAPLLSLAAEVRVPCPRLILDADRLDYVAFTQSKKQTLNSGWQRESAAFVRPFNRVPAGVVRYGAALELPAGVAAKVRFVDAKGGVLREESLAGGVTNVLRGAFGQAGTLAAVRIEPTREIAPAGVFAKPFRVTVGWAADEDFTYGLQGWRCTDAKVVDLPYLACARKDGRAGFDRPAKNAVLAIAPGGSAAPCVDPPVLTDDYIFEFDALVTDGTDFTAMGVRLGEFYSFTPNVWYHFRFEVRRNLARIKLNGREIAKDVKLEGVGDSGLPIRNLSKASTLLIDDVRAYARETIDDYPPAPVRLRGEEKWDVLLNVCPLWYNGRHAGWRCIEQDGGPRLVLGYYDEGLPETADWEIKYMVEHGVDVQLFCWYPESHDGPIRHPRNDYHLRDGFKNARYSHEMKYALIWEIQNAGRPHSLEAWKKNYVPYLIEHHFKDPRYYSVDGKAVLFVFGGWNFPDATSFGSPETTRAAFDYLGEELKKIGYAGVYPVFSHGKSHASYVAESGFAAAAPYGYGTDAWKFETQKERNLARAHGAVVFEIPAVSVGFNSEPWHGVRYPMLSPADFEKSLMWVRDEFIPSQPHKTDWEKRVVLLSNWNEYGEGTYLMPTDDERGFGYLDAVRSVFTDEKPDVKRNLRPTAAQRERIGNLYPRGATALNGDFATRVFREARLTRGNTNLARVQPIDEASWLWSADDLALSGGASFITHDAQKGNEPSRVYVFSKTFDVEHGDEPLVIDVSADERFYLTCDGRFVARGPNRAAVENWQYQTYRLTLKPGTHELRAVVTRLANHAPLAQLSHRGGFILKADGVFDARLTTGKAKWKVGRFDGMKPMGAENGVWGTGSQFEIVGSGPYAVEPKAWREAVVARGPAAMSSVSNWGARRPGWMLFPSQIPDQTENVVRPGAFVAATHDAGWRQTNVYTAVETKAPEVAAFNGLLKGAAVTIPARTRLQLVWNLGNYFCAYPHLKVAGGKGARVSWTWAESMRNPNDTRKVQRDAFLGKYLDGYGDVFVADGNGGVFSTPWFRCGVWCRIDVETKDEPLEIRDLALIESRYPVEMESAFASPDDSTLPGIRRICARAMQMCSHEMLFDCPYYEQQMYPGDTRVQLLVLSALSRDDRMIKRAIELYDLATHDDGQCPFNWPTRGTQEGFTYTLCYLCMFGDYAMNHADRAWLRARLPGLRKSMSGCELYENGEGLIEHTPGWNFMDWSAGWAENGLIPDCDNGSGLNAFANLFWLMAMRSAATTERALGNELQAKHWEAKAAKLKTKIVETFWVEERGLLADSLAKKTYSEHVQALAILTDILPPEKRDVCFGHLISDKDLMRTTVYFSYYLFEAYFKMGRADLFQKRLDLWRGYLKLGVRALLEAPDEVGKNGQIESRSDCHAWGAHPIWFMQTGLAGIRSDAPFFAKVRVAPQPGSLTRLTAKHPHPQGWIELDLSFDGDAVKGTVATPVPGTFVYGPHTLPLKAGANEIRLN